MGRESKEEETKERKRENKIRKEKGNRGEQ